MREYSHVKISTTACLLAIGATVALTAACKRDSGAYEQLRALNDKLRAENARMEEEISKTDESMPDLSEEIESRRREIVRLNESLLRQLEDVKAAEMKLEEFRNRLTEFRHRFRLMQDEVAGPTSLQAADPQTEPDSQTQEPLAQP